MKVNKGRGNFVSENPERIIYLHRRLGEWVIDVTIIALHETVEIYKESSHARAVGVYWFLYDHPTLTMKEAATLINQRKYERHGESKITIEEELARR